jgi:diaminobutyrate-2-oxoglutarate transaminase
MDTSVFTTYESEVRSYCRKFPTVFAKAKNATLTDQDGREYLDFFCGAGACNYGHNNDYIKDKVIEYLQNDGIVHAMDMYSQARATSLSSLRPKVLQPRGLNYKIMFPGPTGTNANEAALKLARKVTGRTNVFCLMGCFHGMTLGTLALTTDSGARRGRRAPERRDPHPRALYVPGPWTPFIIWKLCSPTTTAAWKSPPR